jgi:histidinol-phosphate aminotransferase
MSGVLHLLRPDLAAFSAYHAASPRRGVVRLHANEASWRADWDDTGDGLNRYPDPRPAALTGALAALYGVAPAAVLATRGSDDAIDLLVRAFCRAGEDAVLVCPPTFGMYAVAARLQGAEVVEVPLKRNFGVDVAAIRAAVHGRRQDRVPLLAQQPDRPCGCARRPSTPCARRWTGTASWWSTRPTWSSARTEGFADRLERHRNLVLLRTLSKAWGLAGARVGALLADPELVAVLRALAPPYPLPSLATEAALRRLQPAEIAAATAPHGGPRAPARGAGRGLARPAGVRQRLAERGQFPAGALRGCGGGARGLRGGRRAGARFQPAAAPATAACASRWARPPRTGACWPRWAASRRGRRRRRHA